MRWQRPQDSVERPGTAQRAPPTRAVVEACSIMSSVSPFTIHLSPPDIRGAEREAIVAAIDSGWAAPAGPDLDAFEAELAERCGVTHAVALSSGTAALHLALHANGIGAGDVVLVSTFTFVATFNAVAYTGAIPVLVDSERDSWCIDPNLVVNELERRHRAGRPPKAVIAVDLYGQCADYDRFAARCRELDVLLIEDSAEAIGATYGDRPAGSLGDVGVLSFNGNKLITTSGGGALTTDDADLAARVRTLATHARQPTLHYEHREIGFNYRLSNLLAAFGRAQLDTLDERIADRDAVRAFYAAQLARRDGVTLNPDAPFGRPNHWLTCATVDPSAAGLTASDIAARFAAAGIETRPLWKPMHLQPLCAGVETVGGDVSAALFATGITLPSNPNQPGFYERITEAIASLD